MNKEIPGDLLYEDDHCIVLRDIHPQAPTHLLVIPREPIPQLAKAEEVHKDILGHLLITARNIANQEGFVEGFRVVINNGSSAGETVPHLHIHVLSGRNFTWPPG